MTVNQVSLFRDRNGYRVQWLEESGRRSRKFDGEKAARRFKAERGHRGALHAECTQADEKVKKWWAQRDLNPQPSGYETVRALLIQK